MRSREYTLWLEPYLRDKEIAVQKAPRLSDILSQTRGEPSLLLLIGNTAKGKALGCLATPQRLKQRGRHCGEIHLRLDAGAQSIQSSRPLLFADGPIPHVKDGISERSHNSNIESISQTLPRAGDDLNVALLHIYANLLNPFVDVVCLFLSDFGGMAKVVEFIAAWLKICNNQRLPAICYPRLLVVVDNSAIIKPGKPWEDRWKRNLLQSLRKKTTKPFEQAFSHLSVHHLSINNQIREFRYLSLKDRLLNESDAIRAIRIEKRMHFIGKHFNALFDYAYDHFISNTNKQFNFVKASRLLNPASTDLKRHFFNFVNHFQVAQEINNFVLPVVASAILLDSFPPGMHG